jgi:hypothetical protein
MVLSTWLDGIVWLALLTVVGVVMWRLRRRRRSIGAGAAGTVFDMMHEEKRKAIEIVAEGRAEERDPERADGNLPDLEDPGR